MVLGNRFFGAAWGGKCFSSAAPQISIALMKPSAGLPADMASVTAAIAAFHGPSPTIWWMLLCATSSTFRSRKDAKIRTCGSSFYNRAPADAKCRRAA